MFFRRKSTNFRIYNPLVNQSLLVKILLQQFSVFVLTSKSVGLKAGRVEYFESPGAF